MHNTSHKLLWAGVILSLVSSGALWYKQLSPAQSGGDSTNAAIKKWIDENPADIMASVQKHMEGQQANAEAGAGEAVKANADFLYGEGRHPVMGNPSGDVTIVEFLDYNCGFCKKAHGPLQQLIAKDKNVKIVLVELPILHETSGLAARWALAADELGGYESFHGALMEHRGPINEEVLSGFATAAGLDPAKVKAAAEEKDKTDEINENLAKAQEMTISGTPGFIIGDQIIRGYVELPALEAAVASARGSK